MGGKRPTRHCFHRFRQGGLSAAISGFFLFLRLLPGICLMHRQLWQLLTFQCNKGQAATSFFRRF
jgi:hypothetical protein